MFLQPNGTHLQDRILGLDRTGITVQREDIVLKLPLKYCTIRPYTEQNEIEFDIAVEAIENEKRVYQRLDKHHNIVDCLDISGVDIQLTLMEHGNLRDYLIHNQSLTSILLS